MMLSPTWEKPPLLYTGQAMEYKPLCLLLGWRVWYSACQLACWYLRRSGSLVRLTVGPRCPVDLGPLTLA